LNQSTPCGGGDLDLVEVAPRSVPLDQLGLVEALDRLGQRMANDDPTAPTDGRIPARGKSLTQANDVYCGPVIMVVDQPGQIETACLRTSPDACSSASRTNWVVIVVTVRQPRIRRAEASTTKAS